MKQRSIDCQLHLQWFLKLFRYQPFHLDKNSCMLYKYGRSGYQNRHTKFHLGFCCDSLHCSQPGIYIHLSSNAFSSCCNAQPKKKIRYHIGEYHTIFPRLFSNQFLFPTKFLDLLKIFFTFIQITQKLTNLCFCRIKFQDKKSVLAN